MNRHHVLLLAVLVATALTAGCSMWKVEQAVRGNPDPLLGRGGPASDASPSTPPAPPPPHTPRVISQPSHEESRGDGGLLSRDITTSFSSGGDPDCIPSVQQSAAAGAVGPLLLGALSLIGTAAADTGMMPAEPSGDGEDGWEEGTDVGFGDSATVECSPTLQFGNTGNFQSQQAVDPFGSSDDEEFGGEFQAPGMGFEGEGWDQHVEQSAAASE